MNNQITLTITAPTKPLIKKENKRRKGNGLPKLTREEAVKFLAQELTFRYMLDNEASRSVVVEHKGMTESQ